MNKELNLERQKQNLIKERNYLKKENIQLETVINSQTRREKNEQRLKEIEGELLVIHIKLLKTDENGGEENEKVEKILGNHENN